MFKRKKPEFAIINSFDPFDNFIFVLNYIRYIFKICLFTVFFNKDKLIRSVRKFRLLHYCGGNIYGHKALNLSLIRGFKRLGIPFTWNRVNRHTRYVILLWVHLKYLKRIEKWKKKYPYLKIVTVPTACIGSYEYMHKFAELDYIDYSLIACKWLRDIEAEKTDKKYRHKIKAWPSGVQVDPLTDNGEIHNSVMCYYKLVPEDIKITEYLKSKGITPRVVLYGAYQAEDYYKWLTEVDFVIFVQNITESQGLAMAEAWAKNKPTIIKYNKGGNGGETCPYLTRAAGAYYKTNKELFDMIDEYVDDKEKFLKKFTPYKVAKEKFSDEASVRQLIKILKE